MVDKGTKFRDAVQQFDAFLEKNGLIKNGEILESPSFSVVTWGNMDIQGMLALQCKREQISLPSYFHKWIDLRICFEQKYQANGQRTVNRDGLRGAFRELGLEWEGRLHSGLDDTRNTVRVTQRMIQDSHSFDQTDYVFAKNL